MGALSLVGLVAVLAAVAFGQPQEHEQGPSGPQSSPPIDRSDSNAASYNGHALSLDGLFADELDGSLTRDSERAGWLRYSNSDAGLSLALPAQGWDITARRWRDGNLIVSLERLPSRHVAIALFHGEISSEHFEYFLEEHGAPGEVDLRGSRAFAWSDVVTSTVEGGLPYQGDVEYFPERQILVWSRRWAVGSKEVADEQFWSIWTSIDLEAMTLGGR